VDVTQIEDQMKSVLSELQKAAGLQAGKLLVIGCSTSEVLGKHIGKAGSEEVAAAIYRAVDEVRQIHQFDVAFQCCEHLNRALVVEQKMLESGRLEQVTVVPVPSAGGSMAAYAYAKLPSPAVVEFIRADAGIDIGDTLIGMHLKHVAVPFRPGLRQIGEAHVTAAYTRPKLIGGARAVYERNTGNTSCL
jgi:uncharacterized protein (TIGR01440 family)